MFNVLDKISDEHWEAAGTIFGLSACALIAVQLHQEWSSEAKSSLSMFHAIGFVFVYLFWFCYGIRFRHIGVWLPNLVATALQLILCSYVIYENIV